MSTFFREKNDFFVLDVFPDFFSEKIFFEPKKIHDKKFSRFFLNIYIDVKFHALLIYEVFRAIRARQTTLWSLARCLVQKILLFCTKCGLRTLWAPRSVDLLCSRRLGLRKTFWHRSAQRSFVNSA